MTGLPSASNEGLFRTYAGVLAELRERKVIRTNNPPAGDYAEWLCKRHFGGTLAPNSEKSFDLRTEGGALLQVKARVASPTISQGQRQTSPFRSWDFDAAGFVMLGESDYSVVRSALVPVEKVKEFAVWRKHVNGFIVQMTESLLACEGSLDITAELRLAAQS